MKKLSKTSCVLILFFIIFPLTYLLKTVLVDPLVDNNGVEVSSSLHCELVDQHMDGNTVVVTMKNTGESVWSEQDQIRCTIFLNGEDSGWRVMLQPDQTVAPGECAEFQFYDVKPELIETAEIVMLQETVAYFPERFPVQMPALSDLHCELVSQYMDGETLVAELQNTGGSVWQEADWVRCTIFIDGGDSGLRAKLQPGQIVVVGESAEFRFHDVRNMLNESAELVMLQETVTYFEERFPVVYE